MGKKKQRKTVILEEVKAEIHEDELKVFFKGGCDTFSLGYYDYEQRSDELKIILKETGKSIKFYKDIMGEMDIWVDEDGFELDEEEIINDSNTNN